MYVEPLQDHHLLAESLDADTWTDESMRDAVWLAAAEMWLRRTFFEHGGLVTVLKPSSTDIRIAGASFDCTIWGCERRPTTPSPIFLFTGDGSKWSEFLDETNREPSYLPSYDPAPYQELARRIADPAVRRWGLDAGGSDVDQFSRLQALLWSVQALRVNVDYGDVAIDPVHQVHRIIAILFGRATGRAGPALVTP